MRTAAAAILALLLAAPAFAGTSTTPPTTTNNDDSCDIALEPAATLLLPYFQVDFNSPRASAVQTIFTVQNVLPYPQIANVTLWTDTAYPAFNFTIFLTGYDVQAVNLYDVFTAGALPVTSPGTPLPINPTPGSQPLGNSANPNFLAGAAAACTGAPVSISPPVLQDLQLMFTTGRGSGFSCAATVGSVHSHAIGYATIDVVATCAAKTPASSDYINGVLLFDNVLTGDYQLIVPRGPTSYAQGGSLVHIRAVPEGGAAGTFASTNLPYTFYDRYTRGLPLRTADRRQPLPSAFAPRYIQGGTGGFNTSYKIWRETANAGTCTGPDAAARALSIPFAEVVRFDEHANATIFAVGLISAAVPLPGTTAALSVLTNSAFFPPQSTSGDVAGWIYMNLSNGGSANYSAARPGFTTNGATAVRASQNWVIASMFAEPTDAVELPVIALGNGCSPARESTGSFNGQIGPAPNPTP
jgi:hypothetical protein